MANNKNLAPRLLELVGGKENVSEVLHCMTRLRFTLKDAGLAKLEDIKATEGVLGAQNISGELQIIIGAGVETVYNEIVKLTGVKATAAIQENLDPELVSKKKGFKGAMDSFFSALSAIFTPLVPVFIVVGIFNTVAILLGPQFFNVIEEGSNLYNNFYFVAQAIIYFLPVLVAYTAARRFQANPIISMVLAFVLLYPGFVDLIDAGTAYTIFGIPVPAVTYSSTVIPMILIPFVQSYVEKLLNKIIPNIIKVIVIPCGTILIMLPLALCVLGPVGYYIGTGLGAILFKLYAVAGPVETMLYGAIGVIGIAFGITRPIFFIALMTLFSAGVEYAVMPMSMVLVNWVAMGTVLGYIIKSKTAKTRQFGITCLASNFLGGVSEPSIFGIILPNRKLLISTVVGGALSGLYAGLMHVGYYNFGPSNFLGVIGFIGAESANLVHGCIAAGIALVSSCVCTVLLYREKETV